MLYKLQEILNKLKTEQNIFTRKLNLYEVFLTYTKSMIILFYF